ncbi:formate dehydrogenase accessory protein FdhE [Ottowia sp.]|uniref:formate dehydrogenase accessory protein FdhE n=1 Tax=Ottowia sp. TaxID=1898956 RepID=UPI003A847DF8
MTLTPNTRLRTPEEIALNVGVQFPRLLLPPANVFEQRALRLRELAAGHAMRDYLLLMAMICEEQHYNFSHFTNASLPSAQQADAASQAGQPLLDVNTWQRHPGWCEQTRSLLEPVLDRLPADSPARASIEAVCDWSDEQMEQQACRLLTGVTLGLDLAAAPLLAAGLQSYWTDLVRTTSAAQKSPFGVVQDATRCPCCGSLPTASVTRVGGEAEGHRFLHCSLCNAEWHMVRIKCTHCLSTGGIQYRSLRALAETESTNAAHKPVREAVQAETCDTCGHYLKIVHMDKDLHVDPVADDLASLTLDLLVAEAGFTRHGTNLMLLFGDGDAAGAAAPPDPSSGGA